MLTPGARSTAKPSAVADRALRLAAAAGLSTYDIIVAVDGVPVTGVDDLIRILDASRIECTIAFDVLRRGRLRCFDVRPNERRAG